MGTRGSALALAQTAWVKARLGEKYPDAKIETILIKTSGDRFLEAPIQAIGGKGIFTKEIEDALLRKEIDVAVHSIKDLPTELPAGLTIAAVPAREDPRDVLVSNPMKRLSDLPTGARIGTGSLRRRAQILHYRPDLSVVPIRGNVDTRLRKLDGNEVDALVMAAAGLKRLGCEERISEYISSEICLSAVGQGALGLEGRRGDRFHDLLSFIDDATTSAEVSAERSFLKTLGGGCHVPVGARAVVAEDRLNLAGVVASPDGRSFYRGETRGPAKNADELGRELAERLLSEGADRILGVAKAT